MNADENQNNAQNFDSCARIAYETLRVYSPLMFDAAHGSWSLALHEMKEWFRAYAEKIIAGDIPETPSSERLWTDPKVTVLIVGAIRGMAAALGMQVTYPAVGRVKGSRSFPKRTIDWLNGLRQFEEMERLACTLENCGHMRQLDAIVDLLGMPRGGISVLDWLSIRKQNTALHTHDELVVENIRLHDELAMARMRPPYSGNTTPRCIACKFETEWGTEEVPHPVDGRLHTCKSIVSMEPINTNLIEKFAKNLFRNYDQTDVHASLPVDAKRWTWKTASATMRNAYRRQAENILLFLESSMPTFEEVWAKKEAEGFQYGHDALQEVRFGWDLRSACLRGEPV